MSILSGSPQTRTGDLDTQIRRCDELLASGTHGSKNFAYDLALVGKSLLDMHSLEKALTYSLKALEIFKGSKGIPEETIAIVYDNLSSIYLSQKNEEDGYKSAIAAFRIWRRLFRKHPEELPELEERANDIAKYLKSIGNETDAKKYIAIALDVRMMCQHIA